LLASIGLTEAEVFVKPIIAIISGGDELLKAIRENTMLKLFKKLSLMSISGLAVELVQTLKSSL
jgi:molybdopterin biosynthesis enzyme